MRMPPERALETIAAAAGAGVTVFDTARAYVDNESSSPRRCGNAGRRGARGS
jgi:aryl-alcohol dehydrogenase-like predicted oxidoreductase